MIGQLPPNVIALLKSTMIDWKTELISGDTNLGGMNINRGIFQGDSLSLLLSILSLIPLTLAMIDWKTELISGDTNLGGMNINRGIFQGDSLSLLLSILSLIPLTLALRRTKKGYSFLSGKSKLNHL